MKNKLMMMTAAVAGSVVLSASVQATTIPISPGTGATALSGNTTSVNAGATQLANETTTLTYFLGKWDC